MSNVSPFPAEARVDDSPAAGHRQRPTADPRNRDRLAGARRALVQATPTAGAASNHPPLEWPDSARGIAYWVGCARLPRPWHEGGAIRGYNRSTARHRYMSAPETCHVNRLRMASCELIANVGKLGTCRTLSSLPPGWPRPSSPWITLPLHLTGQRPEILGHWPSQAPQPSTNHHK